MVASHESRPSFERSRGRQRPGSGQPGESQICTAVIPKRGSSSTPPLAGAVVCGAVAPVCRDLVPPSDELKGETETSPAEEKEAAAAVVLGKKGAVSLSDDLHRHSRSCGKALGTGGGGRMFPKLLHPHFPEKEEDKKRGSHRFGKDSVNQKTCPKTEEGWGFSACVPFRQREGWGGGVGSRHVIVLNLTNISSTSVTH